MGEIRDFMRWFRRARDKYFGSRSQLNASIAALETIVNKADAIIPDEFDAKIMGQARKIIAELKEASAQIPFVE
jgi:hypothetical protein